MHSLPSRVILTVWLLSATNSCLGARALVVLRVYESRDTVPSLSLSVVRRRRPPRHSRDARKDTESQSESRPSLMNVIAYKTKRELNERRMPYSVCAPHTQRGVETHAVAVLHIYGYHDLRRTVRIIVRESAIMTVVRSIYRGRVINDKTMPNDNDAASRSLHLRDFPSCSLN